MNPSAPDTSLLGAVPGVPTALVVIPGLPVAPGGSPTKGVPLEQARAAFKALAAPQSAPVSQAAAASPAAVP